MCETVTGKPYDEFAIEALFQPLGIEHWSFQYYEGGPKVGRHPSHGLGMPARDMARIAYCMAHGGRWDDRQVIPEWFVEQTAAPTHDVHGPEMRFKVNAQIFSHGWELPARLTGEGGRSGRGIPADARSKPGSGGQLIAFVPSLDLVVTRQTGSSGDWEYEEFLRRACAAVVEAPPEKPASAVPGRKVTGGTVLGVRDTRFTLNGEPTFLLGISYYGGLGAPEEFVRRDLDDLQAPRLQLAARLGDLGARSTGTSRRWTPRAGRASRSSAGSDGWSPSATAAGWSWTSRSRAATGRTGEPSRTSRPTGGPSRRSSAR